MFSFYAIFTKKTTYLIPTIMKNILLSTLFALITTLGFSQVPSYVPVNGLVGWWPFNGNANDESGNGNNGTVNGATLSSDRFGNVNATYSFNGSNVLIPLTQQIVSMSERTFSLWFYSAQAQSGGRLFEATNYSWGIGCYNSTTFDCWYQKSNQAYNFVGESFQSHNTWYNLVYVCDSTSQTQKIYFNGSLINTGLPDSNPGNPITWQNHFLKIGQGNANESFIGSIDDIGIWNRALTACEIQNLYTSQLNSTFVSAGADQTICDGQQVTLSASNSQNYSWNNGVIDSISFSPTTTQDYIVTADSENCQSSDTVTVFVIESTSSTQTQTALDSYTWPVNNQAYTTTGAYTAVIPNASGCDSTITLNLTMSFTGINDLSASKLSIYPNPTNGDFTITGLELVGTISSLNLTDMNGKVVKVLDTKATKFSMGSIKPGVYFLNIRSGNKQEVLKIVKE
jgi:hypothetical protein